jgi:hypothetical protein
MTEEEMTPARYGGVADWYDEHVAWSTAAAAPLIARLAGRGSGWCLDVGCGTGTHLTALAEQPRADGARVLHPGYARPGWQTGGPGSVGGDLTSRVGFRHLPIARVLNDVLEAELRLCRVEEAGMSELPEWLALVAQR